VHGSGKSSVAAEIGYMLEQRRQPYALLDLDYLSWAGTGSSDRTEEFSLLQNLADVAGNYRRAGIWRGWCLATPLFCAAISAEGC
jgi:hypothetical protein